MFYIIVKDGKAILKGNTEVYTSDFVTSQLSLFPNSMMLIDGDAYDFLSIPVEVELSPDTAKMLVQQHMDMAAQALGYDDIRSAVSYADEPSIPQFQTEGIKFRKWRSLIWATCYQLLEQYNNDELELSAPEDIIPLLPLLEDM
jgi:hypothetical protein